MKMKMALLALVLSLGNMARADETGKSSMKDTKIEFEKQKNENLIKKIETAQKEQFLKFMQKKQNVRDSEYI